jgi:hypothetical protein
MEGEEPPLFVLPSPCFDCLVTSNLADFFPSQALRKVNANTVPVMVGVPKNAEEDRKLGNQ